MQLLSRGCPTLLDKLMSPMLGGLRLRWVLYIKVEQMALHLVTATTIQSRYILTQVVPMLFTGEVILYNPLHFRLYLRLNSDFVGGDNCFTIPAGLPNINGEVTSVAKYADGQSETIGAMIFTKGSPMTNVVGNAGHYSSQGSIKIDASLSSVIYGKSETVMPATIQLVPQIRY